MTRLDDLMALRNRIDAEIKAEMRTVRRLEELSADAGIATTQSEVQRIMRAVADAHSVEVSDMVGPSRERNVTQARMIAAWCELRQDFRHFRADRVLALARGRSGRGIGSGIRVESPPF